MLLPWICHLKNRILFKYAKAKIDLFYCSSFFSLEYLLKSHTVPTCEFNCSKAVEYNERKRWINCSFLIEYWTLENFVQNLSYCVQLSSIQLSRKYFNEVITFSWNWLAIFPPSKYDTFHWFWLRKKDNVFNQILRKWRKKCK